MSVHAEGASAGRIRRVGIVAKPSSREALRTAGELAEWLERRDLEAFLDQAVLDAGEAVGRPPLAAAGELDLVVVLGGDGTLLSVARSLDSGPPILGVNMGSLGFLTEVSRSELYPAIVRVLAGDFHLEERALLRVELHRDGELAAAWSVLNDAVIAKSAMARIIQLTVAVDGHLVGHFRADGLILSTPTGSTAYNLSANGPIMAPQLPVVVLTPICPHTLSMRPIVVPDTSRIEVTLETRQEEVFLTLDGQEGTALGYQNRLVVRRGARRARLVKASGRSFYDSLRGKLRWGG